MYPSTFIGYLPRSGVSWAEDICLFNFCSYFPVQKVSSIHAHRQRTCEGAYFQHPHTPLQECSVSGKQIPNEVRGLSMCIWVGVDMASEVVPCHFGKQYAIQRPGWFGFYKQRQFGEGSQNPVVRSVVRLSIYFFGSVRT